jgi:hypothetical protein
MCLRLKEKDFLMIAFGRGSLRRTRVVYTIEDSLA